MMPIDLETDIALSDAVLYHVFIVRTLITSQQSDSVSSLLLTIGKEIAGGFFGSVYCGAYDVGTMINSKCSQLTYSYVGARSCC